MAECTAVVEIWEKRNEGGGTIVGHILNINGCNNHCVCIDIDSNCLDNP